MSNPPYHKLELPSGCAIPWPERPWHVYLRASLTISLPLYTSTPKPLSVHHQSIRQTSLPPNTLEAPLIVVKYPFQGIDPVKPLSSLCRGSSESDIIKKEGSRNALISRGELWSPLMKTSNGGKSNNSLLHECSSKPKLHFLHYVSLETKQWANS